MLLVQTGKVDLTTRNKIGLTAMDYANKHENIKEYLYQVAANQGKQALEEVHKSLKNGNRRNTINQENRGKLSQFTQSLRRIKKGDMKDWTEEDVQLWLNTIGNFLLINFFLFISTLHLGLPEGDNEIEALKKAFTKNKINGEKLKSMTEKEINELEYIKDLTETTKILLLKIKKMHSFHAIEDTSTIQAQEQEELIKRIYNENFRKQLPERDEL